MLDFAPFRRAFRLMVASVACLLIAGCGRELKSGTAQLEPESKAAMTAVEPVPAGWCGHFGSARDGKSLETLPNANWADREPEMLWKTELGAGAAGVVVHEGRVFATGNAGGKDSVVCLEPEGGEPIWSMSYPCELDKRQFEGGPAATPTYDPSSGVLVVLSHEGELRSLDPADGSVRWQKHLVDDFSGRRPQWGFAGGPLLAGGKLVVETGGKAGSVVALDPASGELQWSAGDSKAGYAAPLRYLAEQGAAVAIFSADGLAGYDLAQGTALFEHEWETSYDVNAATPCYHAGHFFVCSGYGKGGGLISAKGGDAELVYETRDAESQFQSPVRIGDHLYLVTGGNSSKSRLNCLRFDNGELAWSEPIGGNRGSVIAVGDKLIATTERGEAILCEASPDAFTELGRFQAIGGRVWAPPAFADGQLYVRNNAGQLRVWNLR